MAEDKILDDTAEDEFLYMGTAETRGLLMVAPDLQSHISDELHRESAVLKERRKLREERLAARGLPPAGGGGGGGSASAAALEVKIKQQAAELTRLQAKLKPGGGGDPAARPENAGRVR